MSLAQRFLRRIPQYTRQQRHLWSVLRHGTPRKWANLARVELERKARRVELRGHPYLLIIDPCNYCNLRCPLCPTGMGNPGRPQGMLSFAQFREYFDRLAPYLFEVSLHNWGESLLNREVYSMIAYAQARNVGTNLSSNFSDATQSDLVSILDSGLEYLVVSLDGTTHDSYRQYRIRGKFENVVANIAELIRIRDKRRVSTPFVEWQYIVMKHNEHEIESAEEMSRRLGVNLLRFIPVGLPYNSTPEERMIYAARWFPTTVVGRKQKVTDSIVQQFGYATKPSPCFYLYRSLTINPDGGISPCCMVNHQEEDFGHFPADLRMLWNNDKYQTARSLFSALNAPHPVPTVCHSCDVFDRRPHTVSTEKR